MQQELNALVEAAKIQASTLEQNQDRLEQQIEEIASLQQANSLMVQQLKMNQENEARL